jgi:hypothetical protein
LMSRATCPMTHTSKLAAIAHQPRCRTPGQRPSRPWPAKSATPAAMVARTDAVFTP